MPLPGWTKTAWKLMLLYHLYPLRRIPLWRFQGIFRIHAGLAKRSTRLNLVRTLHVWEKWKSVKVWWPQMHQRKWPSQIFKKTSTACVFHVCWLKFLLYPEKRICQGKVGYEFRWITALSLYDCLKRLNYRRSVKALCILRFCGEAYVPSTIPRKHQTCHWFPVGSAYSNKSNKTW